MKAIPILKKFKIILLNKYSGNLAQYAYRMMIRFFGLDKRPALFGGFPIRIIQFPSAKPTINNKEIKAVKRCLRSRNLSLFSGKHIQEFEKRFAVYQKSSYAIAVSSGTAALHCALIAVDIKEGDEVIVPAYTYVSTAMAVLYQRATPIFIDIDKDTANIDVDKIESKITKKTKAIIPVHLHGIPCDMDKIIMIAKKHNLIVIEDAAQAFGSSYGGKKIGSVGHIGCFSLQESKNITTEEGGMIITDDYNIANRLYKARHLGEEYLDNRSTSEYVDYSKKVQYNTIGYNYRMTETQAAIGIEQLKKISKIKFLRNRNGYQLLEGLKHVPQLNAAEIIRNIKSQADPCFNSIFIRIKEGHKITQEQFVKALIQEGIPTISPFYTILPSNEIFRRYQSHNDEFPNTKKFYDSSLGFFISPNYKKKDIKDIIDAIKKLISYYKD